MSKIVCKIVSKVVRNLHLFYCQGPFLYLSPISEQRICKKSLETYCTVYVSQTLAFSKALQCFYFSFVLPSKGDFLDFFILCTLFNTVSADAGIKPRTVATLVLTARSSNHICKYRVYFYYVLYSTLIKKKRKFSSKIRKFRVEQLQSHIWGRAF